MTLDLRCKLTNLDGTQAGTSMAGLLATELVSTPHGPAEQFYDWAVQLHREGRLGLEKEQAVFLREWILQSPTMTILAKAQMARSIDSQIKLADSMSQRHES